MMRAHELLATVGVGALAVTCCAVLPAVLAIVGGVTAVELLGGGVVIAALAGCAGVFVVRARRRRGCLVARSRPGTGA